MARDLVDGKLEIGRPLHPPWLGGADALVDSRGGADGSCAAEGSDLSALSQTYNSETGTCAAGTLKTQHRSLINRAGLLCLPFAILSSFLAVCPPILVHSTGSSGESESLAHHLLHDFGCVSTVHQA